MNKTLTIGIIGDYDDNKPSHTATNKAIRHAADYLGIKVDFRWLPTLPFLTSKGPQTFQDYDGILASPGSPYRSMEGALQAIRSARESGKPFIGT